MKSKPLFFLLAGVTFVGVAVFLSVAIWLIARPMEATPPTLEILPDQVILPPSAEPIATEALESDLGSVDMAALATDLAAIEGVNNVRVMEVKPFQGDWLIYLEIDTEQGFNTIDTAIASRLVALTYTGERMVFNVVLWDRVSNATNYTWDEGSQSWLTTPVLNNPG